MTETKTPVDAAIVKVVTDDEILGERAHLNYGGILEAKGQVGRDFLVLGRLLKENRDKRYFHALGYETFEDFLGSPDIAMSRSMVFDLIRAVEVFIDKLARPIEELAAIGISKLTTVAKDDKEGQPLVLQDVEEWMGKAKELSRSDLQEEAEPFLPERVRRSDAPRSTDWKPIGPGQRYLDYVRDVPCAICGKPSTEDAKTNAAHFPVSKGAGAPKDWVIPMCGDCHQEHHQDPVKFMVTYQQKWAAWFFKTLKMYDDALKNAEETLATYTTKATEPDTTSTTKATTKATEEPSDTTDTTKSRRRLTPSSRDLGLNPRALGTNPKALGTNPKAMGTNPKALGSVLVPAVGETLGKGTAEFTKSRSLSVSEETAPESELGNNISEEVKGEASGSGLGSGPSVVADAPSLGTPLPSPSAEPLKQIWPPAGGFERCYTCHHVFPVTDLEGGLCGSCRPSPVAPAAPDGLAFPKPSTAKRRAKKGVSK